MFVWQNKPSLSDCLVYLCICKYLLDLDIRNTGPSSSLNAPVSPFAICYRAPRESRIISNFCRLILALTCGRYFRSTVVILPGGDFNWLKRRQKYNCMKKERGWGMKDTGKKQSWKLFQFPYLTQEEVRLGQWATCGRPGCRPLFCYWPVWLWVSLFSPVLCFLIGKMMR